MKHPYGMNPLDSDLKMASFKVEATQSKVPPTTCSHRGECCRAGCPNMYYSEYLAMADLVSGWSREDRIEVILDCLRRYLKPQVVDDPKPCLFLAESSGDVSGCSCKVYAVRPLKCRLYGQIPEKLYRKNVLSVAREMGVDKESVPLCVQCDKVKGRVLAESEIVDMERSLREADRILGMPQKVQDDGFGFLTFHDWHLMTQLGTEWMEGLTSLRTKCNDEQKEQFVSALKRSLEALIE